MNAPGDADEVFRRVFEAYPDGVLLVDAQGLVARANAAAAALLGYELEALPGLSVDALVPDNVAPRHAALRHGYALAPRSRPMGSELELNAKRADGSHVMVEIALSPLRENGHDYVVASLRGIGAYPRVKRAMQRAHYNEFIVQLGRLAVDTLEADEVLRRAPISFKEALEADAAAVFLLTPNELELRVVSYAGVGADADVDAAFDIAYPNRPDNLMGHVLAQRAPLIVDSFARETRFEVPAQLLQAGARCGMAVPLVDRGRVIGVLGAWSRQERRFGDDEVAFAESVASLLSTSLQRAQADVQLRHSQRMETVGQLTGGVAHDFNNLLTVVLGNLQMLADQPEFQAHGLSRQLMNAATRAAQRGAELTGKLLAFSRRQSLAPAAVDPVAMLHSLADMLHHTLGEHIHVLVETPAQCPRCLADAVQLDSALLNVAVNARDAMPEGGTMVLRCGVGGLPEAQGPPRTPRALEELAMPGSTPRYVWFSLQDNGMGMPPEVIDRAFEPFFTTKAAGRGTGLGLSTVYGFVKQSQGHIELESTPGAGTTVTLYLPALDPASDDATDSAGVSEPSRMPTGLRVLLVEDDADVRRVAQAFLQSLGCEVQACHDGAQALAAVELNPRFDLLFSDIQLGAGIDGRQLAQQVVAAQPAIAVLLTSGYTGHLEGSGAEVPLRWPVLKKPYDREALAHAMAACLRARRSA